jgi:hypothetical protein
MIMQWIQDQHAFNKLQIFSRTQKWFIQGQAGCMDHAVLTRETMCAGLSRTHSERWDAQIRGMVGSWFGIHGIPVELFQMSWRDGGFSFSSLRDRQNTLEIRTLLLMMTSPDEDTQKLMKRFEIEQARNSDIEYFLNWAPTFEQMEVFPDVPMQSILPHAFEAHQEDQISFWVHNGEQFLTPCIAEPFNESKISKPSMWIT